MIDNENLEAEFSQEMRRIYNEAKTVGFDDKRFRNMMNTYGELGAAKRLLGVDKLHEGFRKLWLLGRIDLTIEYVVMCQKKFAVLFADDELWRAKERLNLAEMECDEP